MNLKYDWCSLLVSNLTNLFLFLVPPVQPKVAKDLAGNFVYYIPDKSEAETSAEGNPPTMKTLVSALDKSLKSTEQVITLSPSKGGNSSVVTISAENILGRFDPETLDSLNQLLDEVVENPGTARDLSVQNSVASSQRVSPLSAPLEGQTGGLLPPASCLLPPHKPTQHDICSSSFLGSTTANPISSYDFSNSQCVNSVSQLNSVINQQDINIHMSQAHPVVEAISSASDQIGKDQSTSQTINYNGNIPPPQTVLNQNSFQTKNLEFPIPSSGATSILGSSAVSENQTVTQPLVPMDQRCSISGNLVNSLQKMPVELGLAQESIGQPQKSLNSLAASVDQSTALLVDKTTRSSSAFSAYHPVQVYSTPSSQYQQSIMSTPKYLPQIDGSISTSTSYSQNHSNMNHHQSLVSGTQPLVLQSSEGSATQNMTDQNMNNIQLQNSEVAELYSYMKQISSKTPLSNVLDQRKLLTAKVPSPSRNGFTQNSGLPTPNVPNHRPMYNIPQALPHLQQYSQNYSTSLSQPHYGNMGLSLTPSPAPPTVVSNFEYKSPSNGSSYRGYMSSSTPGFYTPRPQNNTQSYIPGSYPGFITPTPGTPSSNFPRYPPQFYTPRPQNNAQTYPGYAQNGGLMTGVPRSQLPSRSSHPLKLMPKNQMMEVKKTVSKYQPDFSNYPEVCVCEKYDMGTEIHVEQIWLHMNQMYYLPQVQVLAIGSDEFVGILRDDKYYISVREIMIRMVPKFQEEVESYILQGKCDLGTMTIEEFEYLKQRGCIDVEIHQIISLESLRKMCRYLLNVHSELSSDTKKLTEAATGIYYRKILEKHTRCSKCGGAMKCSDILDRYEAIDCPVGITYKEQKMALLQKEVIENALGKKNGSPNRIRPQQNSESVKIEKIKIGRLMVGGTQFNTFKLKEKCYISLRELVAYKLLTLQVLQSRLENLACRPRPAPSLVDKYFVKNNIEVHNTLWIDTIIVRCMCCLGQQKTHMPLQKHFKCGDFEEIWDKELECVDDEEKEVVYTLNPDTVTISNKKNIQKKPPPKPALPSSTATQITLGPGQKVTTKPLRIKMRDLEKSERFTTKPAYRTYRLSDRKPVKKKVENEIYRGPDKTQLSDWNIPEKNHVEVFKDVNLASTSYGRSCNNRERTPNHLNPDMEPQNEPPAMTEESILEIAAREAMLMPEDLNDDMDGEYPTSVDSVIQSIGMGDGLPSEESVMQEIERGGLNLFDGVLSASICGDSGSKSQLEESVTDKQTEKKALSDKNTLKEPERLQPRSAPQPDKPPEKRKEGRKKRVPKRFEEYDLGMVQIHRDGYCTTVKHNENLLKKSKDATKLHVLHAPLFREKVKESETTQKILNVIKHSEMDSMVEMVSRNAEEAASISPVADDAVEVSSPTHSDDAPVEEEVINNTSNDKILSVPVPEALKHSCSKEQSPEVVDENNVEKLCSPIKKYGNISEPSSPNTSTSSQSEESKSSRLKRACDKVAALESSQDEYRILHMLATVAEVVTESGDEEVVPCDQQFVSDDQQVSNQSATSVEPSAVCESVKCEINSVHEPTNSLDQETCANDVPLSEKTPTNERDDRMSTNQETEPVEEDLSVRDSIIPVNSPVMISDDEFLEEVDAQTNVSLDNVPKLELRERTLKFIDAVNKYVDVMEIQREPGIITSRIRFLERAKLAFPGKSI